MNYGKSRIFGNTVFYSDEVSRCTMHKKEYILTQENHTELEAAGGNIDLWPHQENMATSLKILY